MPCASQPPPSIAGLSRLRRACFPTRASDTTPGAALPAGPWAASLRQLGARFEVLLFSPELLAAASQRLEEVGVAGGSFSASSNAYGQQRRFWQWCTAHPPLCNLHIQLHHFEKVVPTFVAAMNDLRDERQALQVHCRASVTPLFNFSAFNFT